VVFFNTDIWHTALMLILLGCSAFFSGTETAFFSLTPGQYEALSDSKNKRERLIGRLLCEPKKLLASLLLGNMAVNILYFALASVLSMRLRREIGAPAAAAVAITAFVMLVLFGEIVPKSLAYLNSRRICMAAAVPCFVCVKLLSPIQSTFNFLIAEPALRLLLGPRQLPRMITVNQLKFLIESSRQQGLITADENQLLAEIIDFGLLKVRQVMRPRVDMVACNVSASCDKAKQLMEQNNLTKIPVFVDSIDNIVGVVHLRQILLRPENPLDRIVQKVQFVPEQKTVESLLELFRQTKTDLAIVVDEYGGIAGSVLLEDIIQELLGPAEPANGVELVKQIGPLKYRLAGNLSIHDWAEAFGIDPAQSRLSTIGGLATALLGRIPRNGDVVYLKNLKFTIEDVRKHRIRSLILSLETNSGQLVIASEAKQSQPFASPRLPRPALQASQ